MNGIRILDIESLEEFCEKESPVMAILCVPREAAASIAERLYRIGIKNFWNFSHYDVSMKYTDAVVENVHLTDSLMTLCYRISDKNDS